MIEIYCIPNCPSCTALVNWCKAQGIRMMHKTFDPDNGLDVIKMKDLGIYNSPFPVVIINGTKLPPMDWKSYTLEIMKVR